MHDVFENKGVIEIDVIEEKMKNTFTCLSGIKRGLSGLMTEQFLALLELPSP